VGRKAFGSFLKATAILDQDAPFLISFVERNLYFYDFSLSEKRSWILLPEEFGKGISFALMKSRADWKEQVRLLLHYSARAKSARVHTSQNKTRSSCMQIMHVYSECFII